MNQHIVEKRERKADCSRCADAGEEDEHADEDEHGHEDTEAIHRDDCRKNGRDVDEQKKTRGDHAEEEHFSVERVETMRSKPWTSTLRAPAPRTRIPHANAPSGVRAHVESTLPSAGNGGHPKHIARCELGGLVGAVRARRVAWLVFFCRAFADVQPLRH